MPHSAIPSNLDAAPDADTGHLRDLVIAIDHAGARVVPLDAESGTPTDSHRFSHHIDRKRHDADREETDPSDTQFFEAIAAAVAGARRIAVIGHGKGQSNEAGHLMAYLAGHHPEVHARVACELTADLPHSTLPQLLALARHALAPHAPSFTSAGVI